MSGEALAYVDPNTGGFVFQILTPIFFALLGVLVVFYHKTINIVKRAFSFVLNLFHKSIG